MSRYIDKDEAIRRFGELHGEENALLNCYNADWIESFLECQPEANVVEVVRCKDCRYYQDNNGGYPRPDCKWGNGETPDEDDFCSAGERIDNAT